jgi:hypothetical protein
MAINVHIPGWRLRRELLMSSVSALAVVRGAQAGVRSYRTGHHGRRGLASALAPLPAAWRYFPSVRLDAETVPVVAGPNGVFLIETRQAGGRVVAHPTGLVVRAKRDTRTVAEARRRAAALSAIIGRKVRPVIVFASGTIEGDRAGATAVVSLDGLLGHLLAGRDVTIERPDLVDTYAALAGMRA